MNAQSVDSIGNYIYTQYSPSGVLRSIYSYNSDNERVGTWKFFSEEGELIQEINYDKSGYYKKYYDDGELKLEASLSHGLISELRRENGIFRYNNGLENDSCRIIIDQDETFKYIQNDTLRMFFKQGKPFGTWVLNGEYKMLELRFTGKSDYECIVYNPDGTLKLKGHIDSRYKISGDWISYSEGKEKVYSDLYSSKIPLKEIFTLQRMIACIIAIYSKVPKVLFKKDAYFPNLKH